MTTTPAPSVDVGHRPRLSTYCYACGYGASPLWPGGCPARGECIGTPSPLVLADALMAGDAVDLAVVLMLHGTPAQLRTAGEYLADVALQCLASAAALDTAGGPRG